MAEPATQSRVSVADYLAMERAAETKHELWAGECFAMAGASYTHNLIVANLVRVLGNLVVDGPCVVLPSDMKVHVPASEGYVYPDLSVVRGEPRFVGEGRDVIANPSVIVEVLSSSTERFDRGEKFLGYRSLPTLVDYLLVSQTRPRVEHYTRGEDNWILRDYTTSGGSGGGPRFAFIDGELSIDEIYRRVEFD